MYDFKELLRAMFSIGTLRRVATTFLCFVLMLGMSFSPAPVNPLPTQARAYMTTELSDDELRETCGDVITEEGKTIDNPYIGYFQQKITYCTAAKNANDVIIYLDVTAFLYFVLAAICFTACVLSLIPVTAAAGEVVGQVCSYGGLVVGLTDMIWNMTISSGYSEDMYNVSKVVAPIGGGVTAAGQMLFGGASSAASTAGQQAGEQAGQQAGEQAGEQAGQQAGEQAGEQANVGAGIMYCLFGILNGTIGVFKQIAASNAHDNARQNFNNAKSFVPEGWKKSEITVDPFESAGASAARGGKISGKGSSDKDKKDEADESEGCKGSGSDAGLASCFEKFGATADQVGFLNNPDVQSNFEKGAGKKMNEFLDSIPSGASGSQIAAAAMGGGGLVDPSKVSAALEESSRIMNKAAASNKELAGALYGGGGGGRRGGGSGSDPMADMMSQLMGQLNPKKEDKAKDDKVIDFGAKVEGRSEDEIFRDKSISLFQRVEHRYKKNFGNVQRMPWTLPSNRAIAGGE